MHERPPDTRRAFYLCFGLLRVVDGLGLARDIAKKIEDELTYPGQIKVNLLRETKAIDYAK